MCQDQNDKWDRENKSGGKTYSVRGGQTRHVLTATGRRVCAGNEVNSRTL